MARGALHDFAGEAAEGLVLAGRGDVIVVAPRVVTVSPTLVEIGGF